MREREKRENNLKKYRTWKRITQKELIEDLKITKACLVLIESKFIYPRQDLRRKICKYFGVSEDQMFSKIEGKL